LDLAAHPLLTGQSMAQNNLIARCMN